MADSSQGALLGVPSTWRRTHSRLGPLVLSRAALGWIPPLAVDLILLLLASAPALLPLFAQGYVQGADAIDHPWRSLVLRDALKAGILFPRWSPDLAYGYGFPFFNFYSPLSFYPAALFPIVHVDLVEATKAVFGVYLLLAGAGAYFLARQLVGHRGAALLAGVLYLYAPFILSEVYVRSNMAGLAGLALLPYALATFVRLCRRPSLAWCGGAAILVAAMILSHNVTSLVAFGMISALVVFHQWLERSPKEEEALGAPQTSPWTRVSLPPTGGKGRGWGSAPWTRSLLLPSLALALGLGAAAFFWVPALGEKGFTHTEKLYTGPMDFRVNLVDPLGDVSDELYARSWQLPYQITSWGPIDLHPAYPYGSPPYKLSLFQGALLLLCGAMLVARRGRPYPMAFLYLLALLLFFLHTAWSRPIWELVPVVAFVQYPWRLTGPVGLCLAVVGSWTIFSLPGRGRGILVALVGVAAVLSSIWMLPTELGPFEGGTRVNRETLIQHELKEANRLGTMVDAQFLPLSVRWDQEEMGILNVMRRYDESFPPGGWVAGTASLPEGSRGWIVAARRGQQWMQATVEAGEPTKVAFHAIYFQGWTAYVDGQESPIEPSGCVEYEEGRKAALGVIQVWVPEGSHQVTLLFQDTPLRRAAGALSASSLVGIGTLLLLALWRRRDVGPGRGEPCVRPGAGRTQAAGRTQGSPLRNVSWSGLLRGGGSRRRLLGLALAVLVGAGLGFGADQARATLGDAAWVENPVVVDLVRDADRGRLALAAPQGAKAEDYVHPRTFDIGGDARQVLYMHPPSSATARVWLPKGARLAFAVGLDPQVWDRPGDGVQFEVLLRDGDRAATVFSAYVDPKANPADRRWLEASVDLDPFAHREVELVLRTLPGASGEFDWAGWAAPKVLLP